MIIRIQKLRFATKHCSSDLYINGNSFSSVGQSAKYEVEQIYHRKSGIFSELLPSGHKARPGQSLLLSSGLSLVFPFGENLSPQSGQYIHRTCMGIGKKLFVECRFTSRSSTGGW